MRAIRLLPLALLALLASCGPPQPYYETHLELVAPKTDMGRMCANNCLMAQQSCKQSCAMQTQSCQQLQVLQDQNDRLQARNDYQDYVNERTRKGQPIKRNASDFRRGSSVQCNSGECEAGCDQSFNVCYGNCGGQVIPHTVCVANCNLIPQGMPQPGMSMPPR